MGSELHCFSVFCFGHTPCFFPLGRRLTLIHHRSIDLSSCQDGPDPLPPRVGLGWPPVHLCSWGAFSLKVQRLDPAWAGALVTPRRAGRWACCPRERLGPPREGFQHLVCVCHPAWICLSGHPLCTRVEDDFSQVTACFGERGNLEAGEEDRPHLPAGPAEGCVGSRLLPGVRLAPGGGHCLAHISFCRAG